MCVISGGFSGLEFSSQTETVWFLSMLCHASDEALEIDATEYGENLTCFSLVFVVHIYICFLWWSEIMVWNFMASNQTTPAGRAWFFIAGQLGLYLETRTVACSLSYLACLACRRPHAGWPASLLPRTCVHSHAYKRTPMPARPG